jgi:hypothetical protein
MAVVHTAQKAEEIPGVKYTTWNTRCIFIDSIQMSSIYSKNTPGIHNGVFPVVYFFSFLRSATQRSGLEHILSSISSQPPQDGRWAPFVPASYKNMALGEAQLTGRGVGGGGGGGVVVVVVGLANLFREAIRPTSCNPFF